MKTKLTTLLGLCLVVALPLLAQKKEDERLANSATVMREILQGDKGLPTSVLNQAMCVVVFPSVKKVAIGVGGSYGRGALVCRKGAKMNDAWGAPVMYALDQGSLGIQLGSTATDFVLVVMHSKGVDAILNGKMKLGADAAAAAGPTGAQATSYNAADMNSSDVLTYSRSKGLFAGVSLAGASISADNDANKKLYGKEVGAKEIVTGEQAVVPTAEPLVKLLDATSPNRK
ncbi:MAG TPA: lipid-binding SYLF domain-containing protein [Candidatus Sulfotelmatobacter sp.]|nr:lipid-binding SYLF domain-containing protein [Candidatus Sulfotelmatobacter sp.]